MQAEQSSVVTCDTVTAPVRPQPEAATSVRAPSVLQCGLIVTFMKLMLRVRGFQSTIEWIRRRVLDVPETGDAAPAILKTVERSVAMAGALYPGRAMCLEQSLTLYYLLRRQGVPVRYCQGVQPFPFQAHAWVEYLGEVINDVPDHVKLFARLPDQLP